MNDICQAPFTGFTISPQGDICYCCMGVGDNYQLSNIEKIDCLENFFVTSEKLNKVRKEFEAGNFSSIIPCSNCYKREKKNINTVRHAYDKKFPNYIYDTKIKFLEFTSSNVCNATCSTCSSLFSSSWKKYETFFDRKEFPLNKLSKKSIEKIKKVLPGLEWLVIKGGEPFADEDNFDILSELFNTNKNCNVNIVTNMSILKDNHIKILEKNPNKINLIVSMDGTEKIYNWIRSTRFERVIENMEKLYKELNIKFDITITISLYNYFNLVDIFDYFSNISYIKSISYANILTAPLSSSIQSLPKELFERQKKKLCNVSIFYDRIDDRSINHLRSFSHGIENKQLVFDHIDKMNKIRGFDICDHVPELKAWRG